MALEPADPGAEIFTDLGSRLDPSWFVLALLVPAAVIVLWMGSRMFRRQLGTDALEPKGRGFREWSTRGDPEWTATMRRLETGEPHAVSEAQAGPVRFEGTLTSATGTLGGAPGRECVWRNRAGGNPRSAVASDLVVLADATGRCGIENLERARVIAPTNKASIHVESVSLYLGDRIEVMGTFESDRVGDDPDPTMNVYGTVGASGPLNIRVVDRPSDDQTKTTESNDEANHEHADTAAGDPGAPDGL